MKKLLRYQKLHKFMTLLSKIFRIHTGRLFLKMGLIYQEVRSKELVLQELYIIAQICLSWMNRQMLLMIILNLRLWNPLEAIVKN